MVAAAEHVDVEMIDGLAAVGAGVDDDAIAVAQSFCARGVGGHGEQVAKQGRMFAGSVGKRLEVLPRHHQKMGGRLRVDVSERNAFLVLKEEFCRNGSIDDLAEQTIHSGISLQERFREKDNFAV